MSEYNQAAVAGTLFAELSHFGLLRFSGDDAAAFLHGQLSCDVKAIAPLGAAYGSYNTPQGRMLASLLLWRIEGALLMQLPRSLCAPIAQRLAKYVLRSKVKIADASGDYVLVGVAGESAAAAVESALGDAPPAPLRIVGREAALALRLADDRFVIAAPAERAAALKARLSEHANGTDTGVWDRLEILAGIPWITPATQEQFVPQMANVDAIGGVSFNKGCYPGQEIVSRMHYLGRLKQRMFLATLAAPEAPQPGDKLYGGGRDEQSYGMIVNAAPAPEGGHLVLAVIQLASAQSGGVHWRSPQGPQLTLLELPYKL